MKTNIIRCLFAVLLPLCTAHAAPRDGLGLGIMIGEPTGLSVKKWTGADTALDAGIAWSFAENDSLHFHADYLIHRFNALQKRELGGQIPFYYGLGARLKLRDSDRDNGRGRNNDDALLGVRVPLGISYLPPHSPLEFFIEVVPTLDLAPKSDFSLSAAIGVRYYF